MRLWSLLAFSLAAGGAFSAASYGARWIEDTTQSAIRSELTASAEMGWVTVDTDGLQVFLSGTAPDEATRARAVSATGRIVDAARIIDQMTVEESKGLQAPRFSLEILRNDSGVSVFGLVPADDSLSVLRDQLRRVAEGAAVSDFIETANFAQPATWDAASRFAVGLLERLPRAKVSVTADHVALTAMAATPADRDRLTRELQDTVPAGVQLTLDLSVPRPVVSPYTLRFVRNANGTRFDACHAADDADRDQIIQAARAAGLDGAAPCRIALGAPNSDWALATETALRAVRTLDGGALTMTDSDIALIAPADTPQDLFDTVVGELESALPAGFVLTPVLPGAEDTSGTGPAQFIATLSPEGLVQLRGQINSQVTRQGTASFAKALFGTDTVHMAARVDGALPASWPLRVLAGLAALGELNHGAVTVSPAHLSVSGASYNPEAPAAVSAILTERLGEGALFDIAIRLEEPPEDLGPATPTPEECIVQLAEIIGERKITFEPGSATLDATTMPLMDEIAELLKLCGEFPLEIQGHTDSQGREIMNQELSQARAQAVLDALFQRRVLTGSYSARGYGEAQPIADNGTEEGREANRRIEWVLIEVDADPDDMTTLERAAEAAASEDSE